RHIHQKVSALETGHPILHPIFAPKNHPPPWRPTQGDAMASGCVASIEVEDFAACHVHTSVVAID
ncbi:MAG: hypothetical protein CMQ22_07590, partial [Gammaproteobacteria bacterium]|nr:hypothetical protein [Gammaproteobacteria bacterium]